VRNSRKGSHWTVESIKDRRVTPRRVLRGKEDWEKHQIAMKIQVYITKTG
jgi:hypothetical protein